MSNRDRQTITFTLAIAAILLAVAFLLPHVAWGQCGPNGCGVGIGIGIERWQTPPQYRPPSRPQQPTARLPAIANQVTVIVRVPDSTGASVGSGVVIGPNLVLSAFHVVRDNPGGIVQVGNTQGRVIANDATWDLVLIRTTQTFGTYATLANYRPPTGELLFSGGYAGGSLHWTVGPTVGYNSPVGQLDTLDWLVVVSGNRSGDSGGPIFNASGQVVGICWGAVDNQARATVCTRIWQVFGTYLSASAPAVTVPSPGESPANTEGPSASGGSAGANAEQLATKLADSIDALRAEMAKIKAGASVDVKQEVSQAVNVQTTEFGRQLIDKELVPLKQRMDAIELRQDALEVAWEAIKPGEPQGPDLDELAALVAAKLPPWYMRRVQMIRQSDGTWKEGEIKVESIHLGEGVTFREYPHEVNNARGN